MLIVRAKGDQQDREECVTVLVVFERLCNFSEFLQCLCHSHKASMLTWLTCEVFHLWRLTLSEVFSVRMNVIHFFSHASSMAS